MTVLNILITLISLLASGITIYLFVRLMREIGRPTWHQVERGIKSLLAQMQKTDYVPEIIIGVGRGGGIVASIIAGNLGYIPLFVLDTILDRSGPVSHAAIRYPDCCPDVAGHLVLLVVGELYSGEDLRVAKEYIEQRQPREVRTLSLFSHPAASIRPTYVGKETKQPLSAPWRLSDTYKARRL